MCLMVDERECWGHDVKQRPYPSLPSNRVSRQQLQATAAGFVSAYRSGKLVVFAVLASTNLEVSTRVVTESVPITFGAFCIVPSHALTTSCQMVAWILCSNCRWANQMLTLHWVCAVVAGSRLTAGEGSLSVLVNPLGGCNFSGSSPLWVSVWRTSHHHDLW